MVTAVTVVCLSRDHVERGMQTTPRPAWEALRKRLATASPVHGHGRLVLCKAHGFSGAAASMAWAVSVSVSDAGSACTL